jgi:hypothetical protein
MLNVECIHQLTIHKLHFNYVTNMSIVVEHQPFTCAMVAKNILTHSLTCFDMYFECEHVKNDQSCEMQRVFIVVSRLVLQSWVIMNFFCPQHHILIENAHISS